MHRYIQPVTASQLVSQFMIWMFYSIQFYICYLCQLIQSDMRDHVCNSSS